MAKNPGPRNIVILLDGTSNEISARRTNVLRLYGALEKSPRQLVYYDPGVGTFGGDTWLKNLRKAREIWGLMTGWGLDQNVKQAYRFLVENYDDGKGEGGHEGRDEGEGEDRQDEEGQERSLEDRHEHAQERDRIYIFGFSRGAYSARMLAGFIHAVGLIERRNLNLVDYAFRAYKRIGEGNEASAGAGDKNPFAEVRLYERLLDPDRPPIRLLGLFDTVASVIEQGPQGPRLRHHAFTKSNTSVEAIRHAVALDERRRMFRPQLWPEGQDYRRNRFDEASAMPQDAREVWFSGVHGDVGGGYPEPESALAKLPLKWMIDQSKPLGLHYRTRTVNKIVLGREQPYVAPDAKAAAHDSMNWAWSILEYLPLPQPKLPGAKPRGLFGLEIPLGARRTIPEGARVHASVLERAEGGGALPPNLPEHHHVEE